jgi:hypothetical protein
VTRSVKQFVGFETTLVPANADAAGGDQVGVLLWIHLFSRNSCARAFGTKYTSALERFAYLVLGLGQLFHPSETTTPLLKGANMGWLNWFSPSEVRAASADGDMTIGNGARYEGRKPRVVQQSGVPGASDPPLSEDIKRRQVALLVRYVITIRAR